MLSTTQDPSWNDFDTLRHSIKGYTVEKLKHIITGLSEECNANMSKSGKKQDLIDRITQQLDHYRYMQRLDIWNKARVVLYQVRNNGSYARLTKFDSPMTSMHLNGVQNAIPVSNASSPLYSPNGDIGPSSLGKYNAYTISHRVGASSSTISAKSVINSIKFTPSPFFRIDQPVSSVVECPESTGQMDRKSQSITFCLTADQLKKLSQSNPQYQLRLYCTSSSFYSTSPNAFRTTNNLCPIEFPPTCEVRVNTVPISANLKGLKKKPGTAPPADLGKTIRLNPNSQNRVDIIYVNSQQPIVPKKYYLSIFLVEVTSTEQLVERLKKGKFRCVEDSRSRMLKMASEDDDIIAGRQTVSLKCPLSYTRINLPCRSDKCVHLQCFDATIFYSVMEQTTTWQCPICEKTLNPEDLIIDGYFTDVLQQTPDNIEDIIVEPDAEWHTTNDKYGSAGWMTSRAEDGRISYNYTTQQSNWTDTTRQEFSSNGEKSASKFVLDDAKKYPLEGEIVILDSEDEETNVNSSNEREKMDDADLSSRSEIHHTRSIVNANRSSVIIDLTGDSDIEESRATGTNKRSGECLHIGKEDSPSKRSRTDSHDLLFNGKTYGESFGLVYR